MKLRLIALLILAQFGGSGGQEEPEYPEEGEGEDPGTDPGTGEGEGGDPVAAIQAAVAQMQGQIGGLTAGYDQLAQQIQTIGQVLNDNAAAVAAAQGLGVSVANVTGRVDRLDRIQELWRRNFRVVNMTFNALRPNGLVFRSGGGGGGGGVRRGRRVWVRRNGQGGFLG